MKVYMGMLWITLIVVITFNAIDRHNYIKSMDKVVGRLQAIEFKVDQLSN